MTAKVFKSPSIMKLPQINREAEHEEYGRQREGLVICSRCRNVLYKKEWHHAGSKALKKTKLLIKDVNFTLCPACNMITKNLFEGEIIISNVPTKYEAELLHLVAAYGKRAEEIDPQDRIIKAEKQKGGYRVTTTENQLAVKLAKKIHSVFKKTQLHISYSREPFEVGRVRINFL